MSEISDPSPHRFPRWPIYLFGILLTLGLALLGLRLQLSARVREKLDEIRREGYPADLDELEAWYAEPPAGENIAPALVDAISRLPSVKSGSAGYENLPLLGEGMEPDLGVPLPEAMRKAIVDYLAENREALDLLHRAAGPGRARYPMRLRDGFAAEMPHLVKVRRAMQVLYLESLLDAEEHRAQEAAEAVRAGLELARSMEDEPTLISQLVRYAGIGISIEGLNGILVRGPIPDPSLRAIDDALVRSENPDAMRRAYAGERAMATTAMATFPPGTFILGTPPDLKTRVLSGLYGISGLREADRLAHLEVMDEVVKSCEPKAPEERLRKAGPLASKIDVIPFYCFLTRELVPALVGAVRQDVEKIARVRTARAAIAIERFRAANGKLPGKLEELPPGVLKAVPADPYDGAPLRYKRLDPGYVVYSVGINGKDDGGSSDKDADGILLDVSFTVPR